MSAEEIIADNEDKMDKAVEALIAGLQGLRTGRAHPALVEGIKVEAYGMSQPLKAVASITVPESRVLLIQPWDKKVIPSIEKAIMLSDLDITPANDGSNIRLNMPEMTEERRRDMVKIAKSKAEDGRVAVRNCRKEANNAIKKLEKAKEINEDESKQAQKQIQDQTDQHIARVDSVLEHKESEIMQV